MIYTTIAPIINRVDSAVELVDSAREAAKTAKPHVIRVAKYGVKAGKYTAIFIGCVIVLACVCVFLLGRVASHGCHHLVECSIDPSLTVSDDAVEKTVIEEALIQAAEQLEVAIFDAALAGRSNLKLHIDNLTLRELRPICRKLGISQNQSKADMQQAVYATAIAENLQISDL
ncbi:MAG: hypothetical protein LRZ84_14595 [Desertifilum sp.]|nr:hypothetical protein [Desertifilum sp.]